MDVDAGGDEKKPLVSLEEAANDEDNLPDPDEVLQLDSGGGKVWLLKLPRFLLERWGDIKAEKIHLGTLRIWQDRDPKTGKQLMSLFVPSDIPGVREEYKLEMVQEAVENQIIIAEMPKDPNAAGSRAITTIMTGRVKHEVHTHAKYDERYSNRMRARNEAASIPTRQIKRLDESTGAINMLSSGANQRTGAFDSLVRTSKPPRGSGQPHERFARMPQNQLLDALFTIFREKDYWSVKELRVKTEQPEAYLKETLSSIATLHRSGPHNGLWELNANFKEGGAGSSNVPFSSDIEIPSDVKMEDTDDDDDDDDDEDMEEIP